MTPKAKVYDLAAIIDEERSKTAPIEIVAGDETFTIPQPIFWSDEIQMSSQIDAARMLLGDRYDAWCAAGGTTALLFSIIRRSTGANLGE